MEILNSEYLRVADIEMVDEEKRIIVLSKQSADKFPHRISFDEKFWSFYNYLPITQEEGLEYLTKASYRLSTVQDTSTEDDLTTLVISKGTQYFLVGSMFANGTIDMLPEFLKRKYWYNGYLRTHSGYNAVFDQVQVGDRLAVKRLNGQAAKDMRILALGIVTDIDDDGITLYVNWIIQFNQKVVPMAGCTGTIIGPMAKSSARAEIFSI
jgi:hypothetical protein